MVPVGRLAAGDKTHEVRDEDKEEQRGEEGHVLLEAVTDDALAHVVAHELVTVLDGVDELVRRDERELAATTRISTSVMIQQMTIHTMYWVTPPKTTVGSKDA